MGALATPSSIIFITINSISLLVGLLAASLVFFHGLHNRLVYRLALYQASSAMAVATLDTLQIIFVSYDDTSEFSKFCTAIGWLSLHFRLTKLLFTMWIAFHLFCFAVLYKNFKKLELLYVVTSLLVPALIAVVPLITRTYQHNPNTKTCFINGQNTSTNSAIIEKLVLSDGLTTVILCAASTALIVVVIKLARRGRWGVCKYKAREGDQFWEALKQLLPLAAFPIFMSIYAAPSMLIEFYSISRREFVPAMFISQSAFATACSFSSVSTFIVLVLVTRAYDRKRRSRSSVQLKTPQYFYSADKKTIGEETETQVYASRSTSYSPPIESLCDEVTVTRN
ncbi:hypothetical protein EMCRGX_G004338 [Ephydatia muelleri]|eukprot:Em0007g332a